MATTTSISAIPRFLLPQRGLIWRRAQQQRPLLMRLASSSSSSSTTAGKGPAKQIVLEKPEKFNPPSHGSRLPKRTTPRHYGGDLSAAEVQTQKKADYPGLMAPEGTWAHWFFHSRALHLFISLVRSLFHSSGFYSCGSRICVCSVDEPLG